MKILTYIALFISYAAIGQSNYTPTYSELIAAYSDLANKYSDVCVFSESGTTDSGFPLHSLIINESGNFSPTNQGRNLIFFILNGIHPGEPAGINASLSFAKKLAVAPPTGITYIIVPVYNIGGALNRNSHSRANQLGPESYGFRGNAKNLDLNRDCIKADSKNALSLSRLFQTWNPHIFVDTHTSNGADYQSTMTLISPFPERLHPMQSLFVSKELIPAIYQEMEAKSQAMTPYVNTIGHIPDHGIAAFNDSPRYTTGYASLFNTLGFVTEAHMLKPFDDRVKATIDFLEVLNDYCLRKKELIVDLKLAADEALISSRSYSYNWELNDTMDSLRFRGFEADTISKSIVTGLPTLRYLKSKPYDKNIPHQHIHVPRGNVEIPDAYILPQAWTEVIERLDANMVSYRRFKNDTSFTVIASKVETFTSRTRPYEGHFMHREVRLKKYQLLVRFHAGDLYIPTNQKAKAYLAHVFTPDSDDSFFKWNFFDSCLGQKEYYSDYVFDETAAELLKKDKALNQAFEERKRKDPSFAADARAQLDFIYYASKYAEPTAYRLPVFDFFTKD